MSFSALDLALLKVRDACGLNAVVVFNPERGWVVVVLDQARARRQYDRERQDMTGVTVTEYEPTPSVLLKAIRKDDRRLRTGIADFR